MSQKARNILVVAVLAVVIAAGAVGIYFFNQGAGTLVGLTDSNGQPDLPTITGHAPQSAGISWADCRYVNFDPTDQSVWEVPFGNPLTIDWVCDITDTTTAHDLKITDYTFRATAYELPADSGSTTYEPCLDQSDKSSQNEWPKKPDNAGAYNWNTLQTFISQHAGGSDCSNISGHSNIQQLEYSNVQSEHVAVGQAQVNFSTTHNMDKCDWYQYDVVIEDAANPNANEGMGSFRRSYGPKSECGVGAPTAQLGNLEARMYFDGDGNKEYSTPSAVPPGTDTPYAGKTVQVINEQGVDIAAQGKCSQGTQTGGAGKLDCWEIPVGKYQVKVTTPEAGLSGPVKDTGANPQAGEQHNANGVEDLTLTVVEAPKPTGQGNDIITFYDFGYIEGPIAGVGSLLVHVYEEKTIDDEYSGAAEGATFANQLVTIRDDQGVQINVNNPDCPARVDAAGTLNCTKLAPGDYEVDVDPDITTYTGPEPEPHNPQGVDPYTVNVPLSPQARADFQYLPRIVNPALSCTLGANPATGNRPLNTTLTITMSPANTAISRVDWVFGDGQTVTTVGNRNSTTHTYQNAGTFTAVANVTAGTTGEQISCQTIVTVTQFQPTGIDCTLSANPANGLSPLDTTLATTVIPASTQVDSYEYDFGDGSAKQTTSQPTIDHTYTGKNTYTATVVVTDNSGQVATCTTQVKVDQVVVPGAECRIEVVDYMDLDKDLIQDPGIIGYIDPGMDGARVTIQKSGGTAQTKTTAPVPNTLNRYGEASFDNLECGTYTVSIDETSRVIVGGTTQSHILNQLQRLEPPATSTQVTLDATQSGIRVEFGYTPRVIEAFLCDIDKTVADETPADEGNPDDPKVSNSSAGETLTYNITWDCSGFPTQGPLSQTIGFTLTDDFYDPLLTLVPGSITGGGVYNQSQGIITWNIVGAANVDQGSVSFQADIDSNLAPGSYVLPNYVVAVANNGTILDQDQTITNVIVPEGPKVPDIEVIKYATDLNGGQVMPGDVLQYYVVTWNNGNVPLNNVTVTENIQPNVNNFDVITIPAGATDNSTATGGSNGTGYLNVSGFNLPNRGDAATITYQVTVNAGVPGGTQLVNFVTAAAEEVQDTDDETVVVGQVLPTPPPAPPAGPGPTVGTTSAPAVPPLLGPRAYVPPFTTAAPGPAPETGVSAVFWILLVSMIAAFGTAGYIVLRQRNRALEY